MTVAPNSESSYVDPAKDAALIREVHVCLNAPGLASIVRVAFRERSAAAPAEPWNQDS